MRKSPDEEIIKQLKHDARRPIVLLLGTANTLLAGLDGELSEQAQRSIALIQQNAVKALQALDCLFEKLES
jgi:hypothetical protein